MRRLDNLPGVSHSWRLISSHRVDVGAVSQSVSRWLYRRIACNYAMIPVGMPHEACLSTRVARDHHASALTFPDPPGCNPFPAATPSKSWYCVSLCYLCDLQVRQSDIRGKARLLRRKVKVRSEVV